LQNYLENNNKAIKAGKYLAWIHFRVLARNVRRNVSKMTMRIFYSVSILKGLRSGMRSIPWPP